MDEQDNTDYQCEEQLVTLDEGVVTPDNLRTPRNKSGVRQYNGLYTPATSKATAQNAQNAVCTVGQSKRNIRECPPVVIETAQVVQVIKTVDSGRERNAKTRDTSSSTKR